MPPGVVALLAAGAAACGGGTSDGGALNPAGEGAGRIAGLWWYLLAVSVAVVVLIAVLVVAVWWRARRDAGGPAEGGPLTPGSPAPAAAESHPPPGHGMRWVVGGGIVLPAVVLPVTFLVTVLVMEAETDERAGMTVEVTARQWFWDVRYPGTTPDAVTANEIHVPVGRPVRLELKSGDVAHSLWVPRLDRKVDVIPGQTNHLVIEADEAGTYEGRCAEFCGLQHTNMAFVVVAQRPERFAAWLRHQARPAPRPATRREQDGQQVFFSSCTYCHTIRGTGASGDIGPDLTHVATRRRLAAGAVPNTPGHLAGWVLDPQGPKPGNKMPPVDLTGPDLQALLAYLETLE